MPADIQQIEEEKVAKETPVERLSIATAGTAPLGESSSSLLEQQRPDKDSNTKSGVKFGNVRVHQHRLTLGDNPGVSVGIPLTLGWEVEDSETYDLQAFERQKEQEDHSQVKRYTRYKRELIASENHTRDSLVMRSKEVQEIKHSRVVNKSDRAARSKKKKGGIFGLFRR